MLDEPIKRLREMRDTAEAQRTELQKHYADAISEGRKAQALVDAAARQRDEYNAAIEALNRAQAEHQEQVEAHG